MGNTHANNLIWTQRISVVTYNIPALVQIMAWHICVSLRTHTCVTRSQWIMRTHIGLLAHICIGEKNSLRWRFQFSVKSISTLMLPLIIKFHWIWLIIISVVTQLYDVYNDTTDVIVFWSGYWLCTRMFSLIVRNLWYMFLDLLRLLVFPQKIKIRTHFLSWNKSYCQHVYEFN